MWPWLCLAWPIPAPLVSHSDILDYQTPSEPHLLQRKSGWKIWRAAVWMRNIPSSIITSGTQPEGRMSLTAVSSLYRCFKQAVVLLLVPLYGSPSPPTRAHGIGEIGPRRALKSVPSVPIPN